MIEAKTTRATTVRATTLGAPDPLAPVLAKVRRRLLARTLVRGMAVGILIAGVLLVVLVASDHLFQLPVIARRGLRWLPVAALVTPFVLFFRARGAADPERLVLLVDERGTLGNMASTLRRPNTTGPVAEAFKKRARNRLRFLETAAIIPLQASRLWSAAIAVMLVTTILVAIAGGPNLLAQRWAGATTSTPLGGMTGPSLPANEAVPPTLGEVGFVIRPPSYSGLPDLAGQAGDPLSALPGSVIEIQGSGTARTPALSTHVIQGESPRPLVPGSSEQGWYVTWTVALDDRGLALSVEGLDRSVTEGDSLDSPPAVLERRVLPLRLLRDRPPVVQLSAPRRDLILATPTGRIPIAGSATDDYGLVDLTLHWVRSRGSGESFDFAEGEWDWDEQNNTTNGGLSQRRGVLSLSLDDLDLEPGDVLHIRITASDGNTVTGPGVGVSATRRIRISREKDLADITTLIGFPIEREREPLLSQRMIILLTEELLDSAKTYGLNEEALLEAAKAVADEQARLRGRIGEQIFSRATGGMQDPEAHLDFEETVADVFLDELEAQAEQGPVIDPETGIASIANVRIDAHEHDSDPIVAINRSLLTVYNYMWDAERDLRVALLPGSLIPQHLALDELQRVRNSERVFVRGRVSVAPIDVPAARGTGEVDEASPALRTGSEASPRIAQSVAAEIEGLLTASARPVGRGAAVAISGLVLDLLQLGDYTEASETLAQASHEAEEEDETLTRRSLRRVLSLLRTAGVRTSPVAVRPPRTLAGAAYFASPSPSRQSAMETPSQHDLASVGTAPPFVFATVQYESGDWDSAPLVPTNIIHSLAQYTDLKVAPEGTVVDLSSPEIFDYPFLYLTGHLPVFFNATEGRNLVDFVDRGGFIFIDDHNHDIDGAFHRSVISELNRLFGSKRVIAIPNDHELYSSFFEFEDGPPITSHELSGWGDGLLHRQLFGVEAGGRIGVLYSNKDYSSEWSYHSENKRFLAIDNTRFGVNIIVYVLTR